MSQSAAFAQLCELSREAATLGSVASLLNWDQETYMPHGAAAHRAEEQALIAALVHERKTSKQVGELIAACEGDTALAKDPASASAAAVREMRRDYDLATKLPKGLVAELARTGSQAQEVWKQAREKSDFAMFAPWLEKMYALARKKADCYGVPVGGERYDALLNEYEPGATAKEIEAIFNPLRARLSEFIGEIGKARRPSDAPLKAKIEASKQHGFGLFVIRELGFDLHSGRLDVTTHPFCSGMAPGDTRLTTRYRDEKFTDALYGTMHEAGHGLYEQGLPKTGTLSLNGTGALPLYGTPLADSISLGIHESQSRMWENLVGRSRPFWEWALPHATRMLGAELGRYGVDDLYRAVNMVTPSYIRVEADEATYNLHIMLRFEIERALLAGSMQTRDVPGAWNARFKELLGIDVPDDRRGCLQDVHWSFGLIGYFPTYTLGNLYAAQFWETIRGQIGDLDRQIARGEFGALKNWLNTNIHAHGRRYRAGDLCKMLTGKPLSADPFMRYLEGKLRPVYGI